MRTAIGRKFADRFGEIEAARIWSAAEFHDDSANRGSDEFKWALAICIGYQCAEIDRYREHHQIETPWEELKEWIKAEAELASHDGDVDYLSLFAGAYNEFAIQQENR